jgi:hypothetical protein
LARSENALGPKRLEPDFFALFAVGRKWRNFLNFSKNLEKMRAAARTVGQKKVSRFFDTRTKEKCAVFPNFVWENPGEKYTYIFLEFFDDIKLSRSMFTQLGVEAHVDEAECLARCLRPYA